MEGALESENWGLRGFFLILGEKLPLSAVLASRYFSAFSAIDSHKKLDLLRLPFYTYRLL